MKFKAKILTIALSIGLVAVVTCKCQKYVDQERPANILIPENSVNKSSSNYLMMVFMGHDAKNCQGCLLIGGNLIHIDCQGYGTACSVASSVTLNQTGSSITATTTDTFGLTNLPFFNMPARSLEYVDDHNTHLYLNIPAQFLFRDNTTQQFTFTGLFLSTVPAFSNN